MYGPVEGGRVALEEADALALLGRRELLARRDRRLRLVPGGDEFSKRLDPESKKSKRRGVSVCHGPDEQGQRQHGSRRRSNRFARPCVLALRALAANVLHLLGLLLLLFLLLLRLNARGKWESQRLNSL